MTEDERGVHAGADGVVRCWWCGDDPAYQAYHDREWGRPVHDDRQLFEKLCLEAFQAGLAWITILRKRAAFREVFENFEIARVARFTARRVDELLLDARIVRHRGKIEAVIGNAGRALELEREHGSLDAYFWSFRPENHGLVTTLAEARARSTSPEATACAKDLRKRGFRFVGPTTLYAFQQSMGIVNDHLVDCHAHAACNGSA